MVQASRRLARYPSLSLYTRPFNLFPDPEISVRRKAAFLLNTLLTPAGGPSTSDSENNVHGGQQQPVHMNSHAANLLDPSRTRTSALAIKAIADHNILPVVVDGLTQPLPYGEDGDVEEPDADLEEKLFRYGLSPNLLKFPSDLVEASSTRTPSAVAYLWMIPTKRA